MKLWQGWVLIVVLGMPFIGVMALSANESDTSGPTGENHLMQESMENGVDEPTFDTRQPHTPLTPEEREQILKLKEEKAYPWETDTLVSDPPSHSAPSPKDSLPDSGCQKRDVGE